MSLMMGWEEEERPLGDSNPHGEHLHHKPILVSAMQAAEADASVDSLLLDAAPVEPGVLACWARHGVVGLLVLHGAQADDAGAVLPCLSLQGLLWAVLPAEGPGGEMEGTGEVR